MNSNSIGFIILRHVNSELTNQYWITCVNSIRKFYPENEIIIIDDSSNHKFITVENLYKITIVKSKYPKRGELLPYIYYLKYKLFDTAVILHDSVVINKKIDFSVKNYKFLWEFEHNWDQIEDETRMIDAFKNKDLKEFYENKDLWKGCFGAMTIITHNFLQSINNKYDLSKLLELVTCRYNRCSFERVIACLFQKEAKKETLLGNLHKYCKWKISFYEINNYSHLPIVKYKSGR